MNQIRSNCYIYIHGHEAGGTNPSLVEAMSLKLPVCAFDISYNRETTKKKAIYFKDVSSLVEMVENTETNKLNSISRDLFIIANDEYKWNIISKKYYDCF